MTKNIFWRSAALLAVFTGNVLPRAVDAQVYRWDGAIGVAVPTGPLGEFRGAGPLVRAGVLFGNPARITHLRLSVEGAFIPGSTTTDLPYSNYGTMRTVAAVVALVMGPSKPQTAPYVLLGLGTQRSAIDGVRNPYGMNAGMRIGAGVHSRVGRILLSGEMAGHMVLSDFGTGRDFVFGTYLPITIGVTF